MKGDQDRVDARLAELDHVMAERFPDAGWVVIVVAEDGAVSVRSNLDREYQAELYEAGARGLREGTVEDVHVGGGGEPN